MRQLLSLPGALLLLLALPVRAQAPSTSPTPPPEKTPAPVRVAPDSPRASVLAYLEAARAGQYTAAARYLDVPPADASRAPLLARRLKTVLDRFLWIDLEALSPDSAGKRDDGLPPDTEEIGTIAEGHEAAVPVRLTRVTADGKARWVFSRATVQRIGPWYAALPDRWLREHLPPTLLRPGPKELLYWQWLLLPFLILAAWGAGKLLGAITRRVLFKAVSETETSWDDLLLKRVGSPLTLAWALISLAVALPFLGLTVPAHRLFVSVLGAGGAITVFWALWRSVDVASSYLTTRPWARQAPSSKNLLAIGSKLTKVIVGVAGIVAALSALGYPVATLLAGLGIGGIAIAFGAQKTVENLFGSVALAVDQPFRVGDFVRLEDFTGTVESIGLRSTRFRTLDRTLITIPNGSVADIKVESLAARDRLRLNCIIGLLYGTTHAQLTTIVQGIEQALRAHPKIWPDTVVVSFGAFGASSLDVEVNAWFQTSDWLEFLGYRQEMLLAFMKIVEDAGSGFAFPTRTVYLEGEKRAG